ncbi:hypothetical protein Bhyg_08030 [Pseudolycoriella hygida]|uniref:Uncharacterized protein n=1 Tax=Pseudolycoriella hygida TaxID=35572 RepID=A0A9Q0N5N1_9DIPT|nr:hypothetical protein Bhyg_08030 [Pseudolycoriella hygida]
MVYKAFLNGGIYEKLRSFVRCVQVKYLYIVHIRTVRIRTDLIREFLFDHFYIKISFSNSGHQHENSFEVINEVKLEDLSVSLEFFEKTYALFGVALYQPPTISGDTGHYVAAVKLSNTWQLYESQCLIDINMSLKKGFLSSDQIRLKTQYPVGYLPSCDAIFTFREKTNISGNLIKLKAHPPERQEHPPERQEHPPERQEHPPELSIVMSTAKRLVLSLRGRKESHSTAGTSSTRLVSANSSSPGHELDEIAVVSGSGDSSHALYGSLGQPNGPRYIPEWDDPLML